jgi:hypothetical protein
MLICAKTIAELSPFTFGIQTSADVQNAATFQLPDPVGRPTNVLNKSSSRI